MVNLKHLIIECYSLGNMPKELGLLTSLMTLPLFIVGSESIELSLNELNGLNKPNVPLQT